MRLIIIILAIMLAIFISPIIANPHEYIVQNSQQPPIETEVIQPKKLNEKILFELINEQREKNGLPKLHWDERLCDFALKRAIQSEQEWSHDKFLVELKSGIKSGKLRKGLFGENLVRNESSEEKAVESWMNSPSHRENILYDFTSTCIASHNFNTAQIFFSY